jgi:ribosomal protein L11 methyltransferase
LHFLVTIVGAAGDEILSTDAWISGAVGIEELGDDLRVAFSDPETAGSFAETVGGTTEQVADDAGLDEWQAHAGTYRVGPFTIRPPWLTQADLPELVIDPGRAFGSGSHASTQLAVEILAEQLDGLNLPPHRPPRVADIGCGSGVLAIAAASLGAVCVAVDTDPAAIDATIANAAANDVGERVDARPGSAREAAGEYDLSVVNVTIDIHEAIAAHVRKHLLTGPLVVAGLLAGPQEQRAATAYNARIIERRQQGEWVGLALHLHDAFPPDR